MCSVCTKSKLRNDKALLLHVVDADEVSSFFAALFLSICPCLRRTIEVKAVAIVGNPGVRTKPLLNWGWKKKRHDEDVKCERSHRGRIRKIAWRFSSVLSYFGEELENFRLCGRCSRASWSRMNFARCAVQPCQERHSCVPGQATGFL